MTTVSQSTKRKLSLLHLVEKLGNVSKACQIMGYHRDSFYEVQKAFKVRGVAALVEQWRGSKNSHPNRVPEATAKRFLEFCLTKPTYGAQRVANDLRLEGVDVSHFGVRGVWLRHDLKTRYKRLLRLEAEAQEQIFVLSDGQIPQLERHSHECRMRHVETSAPGELLNQDTFYWAQLKCAGKIYV